MRHHWLDNRMSSLSLLVAMKTNFYKQSFISHHHLVNQLDCLFQDYALDTGSARAKMSFSFYIHAILKMWESTGYMQGNYLTAIALSLSYIVVCQKVILINNYVTR